MSLEETGTGYKVGSMRVRIQHQTRYGYDEPAAFGPHILRLRPAHHTRAQLLSYNLSVEPEGELRWQQDPWGNHIVRLTYPEGHKADEMVFTVDAVFDVRPYNPFDFFVDDRCQKVPFAYPPDILAELGAYLDGKAPAPLLAQWLKETPFDGYITDFLVALNQKVAADIRYIIRNEPGVQSSEETLTLRSGSCRDSALLLVDALRAHGLAARFVSGYLIQLTDEGNIPDLARGVSADVVDLHAWAEVYVPGAGWIGLDGTSGLLCNEGHIPLACTARPEQAAPIEGTASHPSTRFEFSQNVGRLGHEPTPHKPYTDEQWQALLAAGVQVDEAISSGGLALTVGGEPTWTSRENPLEREWITEALGPTKWSQGLRMARELARRLGPGSLVLHRMGKIYPGESLPRWNLQLIWREDGVPVWRDDARMALAPLGPGEPAASAGDALRFLEVLAARLGVEPQSVPGYEDPWAFLAREENLPPDVDLTKINPDDPEERRTLARTLERGVGAVVGYAMPIARAEGGWVTSIWKFRRNRMYLLFGDSPMGLRLPLDRLGGEAAPLLVKDVTLGAPPLTVFQRPGDPRIAQPASESPTEGVRTALCVEPREGVLHVFLPPLTSAEAFLELIAEVEATAEELGVRVRVEGYPPPSDSRLRSCLVTPDPGVIEINVPVSRTLGEYAGMMEKVAEAALRSGLSTEKYQIDGREVGSGGGNHITLGGPTTAESPWLQRPELLASLLRYIQNHPSLSFLFTGLFVGPTSQAPRIDEGRHDALLELERALARLPPFGADVPPWFVDRLLRNLLVDVAGNAHRTEICIDKLYDPAGLAGRQGLVEFRAFEMPPHERMAVAQVLVLRALVAMFLREPYHRPLVRWGTELHDRFMLPHYLWADFRLVLAELADRGFSLDEAWYQPFLDYRFPILGAFSAEDVSIELRPALEPWPVLGEEATGATVSRFVDSSLERLQIRVDGLTEGRHLVLVNGLHLPLRPTGRVSERVAGVRFRAWQPPHCLHPHIGVHHPLHFDVVDTWGKRSLGACTYHVWHPDGRAYEDPPLTAFEAGARRAQRFTTRGHLSWPVNPVPTQVDPEHPYTLDLRRYPGDRRV